jgi:uncharacterized membrane-anchored protein
MEIIFNNQKDECIKLIDSSRNYFFTISTQLDSSKNKFLEICIEDIIDNLILYEAEKFEERWNVITRELLKNPTAYIVSLIIKLRKGNKKMLPRIITKPTIIFGDCEYNVKIENNKLYINETCIK